MKKEEMIATLNERFNSMNEEGVEALFNIIMAIPDRERWMATTTPERIAELDALKVQRELEEKKAREQAQEESEQRFTERRNQAYHDYARMFDAINAVKIPARYDINTGEITAIDCVCGEVSRYFPDYMLNVVNHSFCYGFVKGSRYAKAQAKKQSKKESH